MADNFLERHREEYEIRKAAWLKKKKLFMKSGKKRNRSPRHRCHVLKTKRYKHEKIFRILRKRVYHKAFECL